MAFYNFRVFQQYRPITAGQRMAFVIPHTPHLRHWSKSLKVSEFVQRIDILPASIVMPMIVVITVIVQFGLPLLAVSLLSNLSKLRKKEAEL